MSEPCESERSAGSPREPKRIGHGGAAALARLNTLRSFDAALGVGVDMIEFDVRRAGRRLVLAHTRVQAHVHPCPSLGEALDHLREPRFSKVELNADVKCAGCERELLVELRARGLLERTLISSQLASVLDRVRELEPAARTGISIGGRVARRSHSWGDWRARVGDALGRGRFQALMAHHGLVDAALVRLVREAGAELHAWTVDDRRRIERLRALGVSGIVTNDPRLFAPAADVPASV